jgi:hypothetical protein
MFQQEHTGGRQRTVSRGAIDQAVTELVLEPADGLADGRLRSVKFPRRDGETALLGNSGKRLEVL